MNAKNLGCNIARLRKKVGLTQKDLAQRLNVSDKAISRWENGTGYPDITHIPALSKIFGVSIDYLMTGERKGIAVAGNIIADIVNTVTCYPRSGMLASILSSEKAVGGCVPNTAIDLAKIDRGLPVSAVGKVGNDENGRFLLSQLCRYGIDCEGVSVSDTSATSFCVVMSISGGERTFFSFRGASSEFCAEDIDLASLNCQILHIGYILLLDALDKEDEEYGTAMARLLCSLQEMGIKTSIDVVSDSLGRYKEKIIPALKYCTYAIMNETESSALSELPPYDSDGNLIIENIKQTMRFMAECGVSDKVIIHCKQAGFCYDVPSGTFTVEASLNIPKEMIMGGVGAGDAFCAGCLYALYHGYDDSHMLKFASSAAACNLFANNSVDGMLPKQEIEKLEEIYGRKKL